MGTLGCAIASLISIVAMNLFQLWWTSKKTKIPLIRIWPWSKIFFVLFVNFCLLIIFTKVQELIPLEKIVGNELESIIYAVIWAIMYFLIWKFRIIIIFFSDKDNIFNIVLINPDNILEYIIKGNCVKN